MIKNKMIGKFFLSMVFVFVFAANANALITVDIFDPGNSGITWMEYEVDGYDIEIRETWGLERAGSYGFLEISGLERYKNYTITKIITNSSGVDWNRFSNELLDPSGQANDDSDVVPYPGWVPSGFTTSNELDGLSFAQGSGIPRTSISFADLEVDELTDKRDFIDFYSGVVSGSDGTDTMKFGLRDKGCSDNQPFLLAQRPNEFAIDTVPEPATMSLLGLGLLGWAGFKKRFTR